MLVCILTLLLIHQSTTNKQALAALASTIITDKTTVNELQKSVYTAGYSASVLRTTLFDVGEIHSLPFEDGAFDVVHTHQVLQHISDPVKALREMRRVTETGGLVACRESASLLGILNQRVYMHGTTCSR